MKRLAGTLGILWLIGCTAGPPRQPPQPLMPTPWVGTPRVYALIGQRATLQLTSQQVVALDSLGTAHQEQNAPLLARVRELRGESTGRPRTDPETNAQVRPLLVQIRDNNQAAYDRVRAILNDEQERKVCEVTAEDRREEERRREREVRDRRFRRPGGMRADTLPAPMAPGGWPWCGARPAAGDTTRTGRP